MCDIEAYISFDFEILLKSMRQRVLTLSRAGLGRAYYTDAGIILIPADVIMFDVT